MLASLCLMAPRALAQVDVPPSPGALNEAVNDNATSGEVFRLQAGDTYLLTDRMEPTVDVVIEADGGDCPRVEADCPLIQPIDPGGGPERILQVETADVAATLRQVALTNFSPDGTSDERTFRLQADGATLTLDQTLVFGEPTMVIRIDNSAPNIYIYDSIFREVGDPEANPDLGRVIDDRGNDIGDLVLTGNTFYSINNRIIRDDGGSVGFLRFENNTVHLVGRRILDTGDVTGDVTIRNNLIVDAGLEGSAPDDDDESDDREAQIQLDEGVEGRVTITHNSFAFNDELLLEPSARPIGPRLYNGLASDAAEDGPTFTFRPALSDPQPAFFDFTGLPYAYDYGETQPAFVAATDAGPLGARLWFDGLAVTDPREVSVGSFAELEAALDDAQPGDVITLTAELTVTETLENDVPVTIRGADPTTPVLLIAAPDFADRVFEPEGDLTLEHMIIDGAEQVEEFVRVRSEDQDDDGDDDLTLRNVVLVDNANDEDGLRFDGDAGDLRIIDSAISGVARRPIAVRNDGALDALVVRRSTVANSAGRVRLQGAIDAVTFDRVTVYGLPGDAIDFDSDDIGQVSITNANLISVAGSDNRAIDHTDSPPEFTIDYTNVFPLEDANGDDNLDDAAEAAYEAGTDNLEVDPQFSDPDNGDFALPDGSPLLTAADGGGPIGDPNVQILVGVDVEEVPPVVKTFRLDPAFPNPATRTATVRFDLPTPATVRVEVFDVLGRRVLRVVEGSTPAGTHVVTLDASDLAAGLYLVRLTADERAQAVPFTIVR